MPIDYNEQIPNNVGLSESRALQRALEQWQPAFLDWWHGLGPTDLANQWGHKYAWSVDELAADWRAIETAAVDVRKFAGPDGEPYPLGVACAGEEAHYHLAILGGFDAGIAHQRQLRAVDNEANAFAFGNRNHDAVLRHLITDDLAKLKGGVDIGQEPIVKRRGGRLERPTAGRDELRTDQFAMPSLARRARCHCAPDGQCLLCDAHVRLARITLRP